MLLEVGAYHPAWGDIHLGPKNALDAAAMLGGGALLPVHWGTFCLAMHAWDQPAEELLALGPKAGTQLLMPRLGQSVEPAHAEAVDPWWRGVDTVARPTPAANEPITLAQPMPWPID
jgi:L-ascorbate metabolism protein UlaG (beta-lactamase superfamily)